MNEFQKTTPSTASTTSSVSKMPFYVADAVLILAAICILAFAKHPLGGSACWALAIILGCGAWIAILPWFQENKNNAALSQLDGLRSVGECIQQMNTFSAGMNSAIASLANVQKMTEASARAASEAENKIVAHSQDFAERLSKAVSYEKSSLQMQIDKLRRAEDDWIHTGIGIMDHVLALSNAGIQSGKPEIAEQMRHFRGACLEFAARAGLQPFIPAPTDTYDPEKHILPPNTPTPEPGTRISRVLVPGFQYQGQLIRKAMILAENIEFTQGEVQTPADAPVMSQSNMENTFSSSSSAPVEEPAAEEAAPVTEQAPEIPREPLPPEPAEPSAEQQEQAPAEEDTSDLFRQESFESILTEATQPEPETPSETDRPAEENNQLPL
ncbi:MAG: nucleotide exchange factor GrpE [Verrucomicrobia bacterium]|nr:nucleotide exchange factor GrpE [Verrucomicrobiota bacterium]